jgi:hypothetical protein
MVVGRGIVASPMPELQRPISIGLNLIVDIKADHEESTLQLGQGILEALLEQYFSYFRPLVAIHPRKPPKRRRQIG